MVGDFGLRVWVSGFGVQGLGFRVWGLRFGVWGLRFRDRGSGFRVQSLGFGVRGLGFGVRGLGSGVWGFGLGWTSHSSIGPPYVSSTVWTDSMNWRGGAKVHWFSQLQRPEAGLFCELRTNGEQKKR